MPKPKKKPTKRTPPKKPQPKRRRLLLKKPRAAKKPPVETLTTRDDMGGEYVLTMPEAPAPVHGYVRRFSKPKRGEDRYSTRLAIKATPQELTAWHRASMHIGRSTSAVVRAYLARLVEQVNASIERGDSPASRRTMELPHMERPGAAP